MTNLSMTCPLQGDEGITLIAPSYRGLFGCNKSPARSAQAQKGGGEEGLGKRRGKGKQEEEKDEEEEGESRVEDEVDISIDNCVQDILEVFAHVKGIKNGKRIMINHEGNHKQKGWLPNWGKGQSKSRSKNAASKESKSPGGEEEEEEEEQTAFETIIGWSMGAQTAITALGKYVDRGGYTMSMQTLLCVLWCFTYTLTCANPFCTHKNISMNTYLHTYDTDTLTFPRRCFCSTPPLATRCTTRCRPLRPSQQWVEGSFLG